jgi:hypothetical protein
MVLVTSQRERVIAAYALGEGNAHEGPDPVLHGLRLRTARGGLAAHIKEELGIDVEIKKGASGQFDVLADGQVIAQRKTGLLSMLLGGGWPEPREVVSALARRNDLSAGGQ